MKFFSVFPIIALFALLGAATTSAQTIDGEEDERRVVPNVIGLLEAEAVYLLDRAGLVAVIEEHSVISFEDIDTIASQVPRGGQRVLIGEEIRISLSGGYLVPELVGLNEVQARRLLSSIGLTYENTTVLNASPLGTVVWQEPEAGARVNARETVVALNTSRGEVRIPERILGSSSRFSPGLRSVRRQLSELNLDVEVSGCTGTRPNFDPCLMVQHCIVTQLEPPPGEILTIGSTVTLSTEHRHEQRDLIDEICTDVGLR